MRELLLISSGLTKLENINVILNNQPNYDNYRIISLLLIYIRIFH